MSSEDKSSKTEEPTAKKLKEAREQGQIARSQDLVAWTSILASIFVLEWTVKRVSSFLGSTMALLGEEIANPDIAAGLGFALDTIKGGMLAIVPLIGAFCVFAILGHVSQVRFVLAYKAMKPSFKKMNPITGIKRMFGAQGLFNVFKEVVKTIILAVVAYYTLYGTITDLSTGGPYPIHEIMRVGAAACLEFVKYAAGAACIVGLADYVFQYRKTKKELRMSVHEVKQENKQMDLAPEIKGKIKRKQMEMSRNRMMSAIADADVVVANPVHIAVAITYDASKGAPRVVAKGAGFVAEKIRDKAEEENILIVQDIPLARTLHKICDIGDEIPGGMFEAVAQLLAFVFALKKKSGSSGIHKMPGTPDLEDMERADVLERASKRFGELGEQAEEAVRSTR